jgi:thiol-disulfide isomerase/thioredoxin
VQRTRIDFVKRWALAALASCVLLATAAAAEELAIGAKAPDFKLLGTDNKQHTLDEYFEAQKAQDAPKAVVVVFTCNHCPYAKAYEPVLLNLAQEYRPRGVRFVLISSNDPQVQPEDSFELMQARAKEKEYPFPYLYDATQSTAKAYGARVTPHIFMLDSKRVLRYRGRINDNKDQAQVTSNDLVDAMTAVLAGKPVENAATKAFGCTIKWKKAS